MNPIALAGFAAKFAGDADPWRTFSNRDEALKRAAILHALGPRALGRVLELASGNGSNSVAIARRSLRLDATEGTREGVALTAQALARAPRAPAARLALSPRARASRLALPGKAPRSCYDAIVIAELLYYLSPAAMAQVARDVAAAVPAHGLIVLAHHRIDFYDFAQHAAGVQARFLASTRRSWQVRIVRRTARWSVIVARPA